MKVLHVWSQSSIAQLIARYINKKGEYSRVFVRSEFDNAKYGFSDFYSDVTIQNKGSATVYKYRTFLASLKYDIIHIHDVDELIPLFRKKHNKIVLTYHGSSIRNRWNEKKEFWKLANKITVVNPDLLEGSPENTRLILNPIDIEHFTRKNRYFDDSALHCLCKDLNNISLPIVNTIAKNNNLNLRIMNRNIDTIPYSIFPRFLELFEYYIDVHQSTSNNKIVDGLLNLISLQNLALGGTAIDSNGKKHYKLSKDHLPDIACQKYYELYEELL